MVQLNWNSLATLAMQLKFTGCTEEERRACFHKVCSCQPCHLFNFTPFLLAEDDGSDYPCSEYSIPYAGSYTYHMDLIEEIVCRNALQRLEAYTDDDDEVYLLQTAEEGNPVAQLAIADLCATPLDATRSYLPPHHVAHCLAVTRYGA